MPLHEESFENRIMGEQQQKIKRLEAAIAEKDRKFEAWLEGYEKVTEERDAALLTLQQTEKVLRVTQGKLAELKSQCDKPLKYCKTHKTIGVLIEGKHPCCIIASLATERDEALRRAKIDREIKEAEKKILLDEIAKNTKLREAFMKAVDDEPEYPDSMPDEMWEAINGDRDAVIESLRLTVRLTKQGIKGRAAEALQAGKEATHVEP